MKYGAIYIDPPWPPKGGTKPSSFMGSGASDHYPLMKMDDIKRLPVSDLTAESAHLWLWTIDMFLIEAIDLIKHWDFRYTRTLVWGKTSGRGNGMYLRTDHEICLFCVRGNTHYPPRVNGKRPAISSLLLSDRREHSRKPDEMYSVIESVSPGPYLEMFARNKRQGWHSWGNEVSNDVDILTHKGAYNG